MSVQLTLDQARCVFEQLALLKSPQNKNVKLCFSTTQVYLESDSTTWRTTTSKANYYFPSFVCSRNLASLYPLVQEASQCFFESAKTPADFPKDFSIEWASKAWKSAQEIRAAREGLEVLKKNKYSTKIEKAKLVDKSIECLLSLEEKIKKPIRERLGPELVKDETQDIALALLGHLEKENEKLQKRLYDALYTEK